MRKLVLSISAILAACAADRSSVDMQYHVTVETLEDTCGGQEPPPGFEIALDARLRADGDVDLTYPSGYAPGRGFYESVGVFGSKVDYTARGPSASASGDDVHRITGTLTMSAIDLTIEERRGDACVRRAKLRGGPRPFWEADALDGAYGNEYAMYGYLCPGDATPEPTRWRTPLDLEAWSDGSMLFAFDSHDENLTFEIPAEAVRGDGIVEWSGLMFIVVPPWGFYELEGTVVGPVTEGGYGLRMTYHVLGDASGCDVLLEAGGAKRAPDAAGISGAYRLAYAKTDGCEPDDEGNPTTEAFGQVGHLEMMDDGTLTLMHGSQRFDLGPTGDATYGSRYEQGGASLVYALTVDPPHLAFTYVYELPDGEGTCRIAYEVAGAARYFPDVGLEAPEFPEVETASSALALAGPKLTALLPATARMRPMSEAPPVVLRALAARTSD